MIRWISRAPLALSLLALSAVGAAAQSGGTLQPVQSTLTQLVQALTGPIATALATLAVIACGLFAWSGRLTWGIAGSVIFGIVLVFGSAQIVQFFQSAVGQ
ncbi:MULTISPECIES: TrbC/VirB2 family protein [Hyphomicrobiales]|uniref:TrbC/VirB2 family protein n=1 Tax=Ancylobacter polymorphus TaxID=223390 RepID=A0A9E7A610_9HYPH|nr:MULTISPECIES: TrbC/VirB2 family protein [Hyphomicrobiales]CAH1662886.1 Major pilus subunit of type IV secretion complex (VirB2) [Hyphomicrobiales bacterium]ETR79426.1 conjugal transfer protein TrbC [Afipia sp. P52-10]MBS7743601.1 TrbC/VIRB2 family protein [Chelatococcus sp. HY11]MBX3546496.1 TrbC/VIRB2 family protein [Chelatococcus sp.]MCO5079787.1 TrbC/VirB2 family protein [Chelatococcus sp.]